MGGMSDSRYKWTLVVCCITAIAIAFIWKFTDVIKADGAKDAKLGEYIYVDDDYGIIHSSRKCSRLNQKGMGSRRLKLDDMYYFFKDTPVREISFCPKCVSDKDYEKIINIFSKQIEDAADEIIKEQYRHE